VNGKRQVRRRITAFPIRNSALRTRRRLMNASMTTVDVCPECGLQLTYPVNTGGLCPRCLIAAAVENLSTVDHPALGRFGAIGSAPNIETLNAQLPAYEFCELLGRGGAGWVFRALQRSLNRPVAIKILHGSSSGVSDAAQRFAREAQILARLNHPRIVTVHDYGILPESQYLVMEYVPGPTLRYVLRAPGVREDALRIADQICEAVEYAHTMGVLHRDLKPENVLFESNDNLDTLKVADFGISRLLGGTEPGFHQTQTGFVVGTPFYAAPEQMAATGPVDARADIYSIGVMLYEMLTGQLPRGRFPSPSRLVNVPAGIDAVVLRCLESDPTRRYSDVASLRKAIQEVKSGATRRRRVVAFSLASAALAALAIWALLTFSNGDAGGPSNTVPLTQPNSATPTAKPDVPPPATPDPTDIAKSTPPQPPVTTPSAPPAQQEPPPLPSSPLPEDEYFNISKVEIYGQPPFGLELRIDARQANNQFKLKEGASLVWVAQTSGVHRVDVPFKSPEGQPAFTIADQLSLDMHDRWPIEIYIAERWYKPTTGSRRLSNTVRVNSRDVHGIFGLRPTPDPKRVLVPGLNYHPPK
jgi:serine/threonine protein kinase